MASSLSNNLIDFDTPIHVVKGFQGNDLTKLQQNLKTKKIIGVDEDGDVEIKTVDIPYQARQAKLELDEKNIYRFGMGLNMSGLKDTSATTNIAIKAMYSLLELRANCVNCTIAYEMRERGYAVVAGDVNKKLRDDPFCGWVNPNVQKVKTNDPYSEIVNSAKQWGAGSRGQITVLYKERRGIYSTSTKRQGHSFNIKNVDGNIQFVDSQKGKIYNENEIKKIFSICEKNDIKYAQVDKLDVNDRGSHACKKE